MDEDERLCTASAGDRLNLIASSFARLTRRRLVPRSASLAAALWTAPRAILAHGEGEDPLFFYGNRLALSLFEMSAGDFIGMPSRLSAEPVEREERARLLQRVGRDGYIDDYSGIRISATARRFRIARATVWNLVDEAGHVHGQAATFTDWAPLD